MTSAWPKILARRGIEASSSDELQSLTEAWACGLTIRSSRDRFAVSRVAHSPAAVRLNSGVSLLSEILVKCPHCHVAFHEKFQVTQLGIDKDGFWSVRSCMCPTCSKLVVELQNTNVLKDLSGLATPIGEPRLRYLARPRSISRPTPPPEVPEDFSQDYVEAASVLSESPKASAALSRRCLQHIIHDKAGIKRRDLATEIQELIDSNTLPSFLSESIDAIRNIGNFAAHPIKSTSSGEIVPVEPGEAEWTLDVLDGLFDFYFVQPAILKRKREDLAKKLADAGKPGLKG